MKLDLLSYLQVVLNASRGISLLKVPGALWNVTYLINMECGGLIFVVWKILTSNDVN